MNSCSKEVKRETKMTRVTAAQRPLGAAVQRAAGVCLMRWLNKSDQLPADRPISTTLFSLCRASLMVKFNLWHRTVEALDPSVFGVFPTEGKSKDSLIEPPSMRCAADTASTPRSTGGELRLQWQWLDPPFHRLALAFACQHGTQIAPGARAYQSQLHYTGTITA